MTVISLVLFREFFLAIEYIVNLGQNEADLASSSRLNHRDEAGRGRPSDNAITPTASCDQL
jgi:hypothetical protein